MIKLPFLGGFHVTRRSGPGVAPEASAKVSPSPPLALSYPWRRIVAGLAVTLVVALFAAGIGAVAIPPLTVAKVVLARLPLVEISPDWPAAWETILWQLRLPRIALAAIVGGALALSGAAYQGLFRNPLADPYLIGVSSGAGLGATVVLVTAVPLQVGGFSLLPVVAFAGAIAAVTLAYVIARTSEGLPLATLILAGVAISAFAAAITALLMIRSDPELRPVLSWLLGGFISAEWKDSVMILPYLIPSALILLAYGRIINVLQLGEEHAQQLGVNVESTKLLLIAAASLATAAAVSFSGLIGFVGLIAPHAVRLVWSVDYRSLLPMAAIVGAAFLILADLVARTALSPAELPVGIVTASCGAPFFLYLLRRRRSRVV